MRRALTGLRGLATRGQEGFRPPGQGSTLTGREASEVPAGGLGAHLATLPRSQPAADQPMHEAAEAASLQLELERRQGLLDLPALVFDHILRCLPFPDRMALISSHPHLAQLAASSAAVWEEVSLHARSAAQLHRIAAALTCAAPRLKHLRLSACWLGSTQPTPAEDAHHMPGLPGLDPEVQSAGMKLAAALAGARALETLEWAHCTSPCPQLAHWALPALRSMTITCRAPLRLPACWGKALPALQELRIFEDAQLQRSGQSGLKLEYGSLSGPSLRRLEIAACGLLDLPSALDKATGLTELALSNSGHIIMNLGGLRHLTGLRRLGLHWVRLQPDTPNVLAELTNLECLDLSGCSKNRLAGTRWGDLLRGIATAGLRQLRELCLGRLAALRTLPPEVLAMPGLRVLHLECNPGLLLPGPAQGCQLEHLTLDASLAEALVDPRSSPGLVRVLAALRGMPELRRLALSGASEQQVAVVQQGLAWHLTAPVAVFASLGPSARVLQERAARWEVLLNAESGQQWRWRAAGAAMGALTTMHGLAQVSRAIGSGAGMVIGLTLAVAYCRPQK